MSKLSFDGKSAWFISPDNKYGLSTYPIKKITTDNFSFLTKVKVDWDKMDGNGPTKQSGIVMINGLHMGISAYKSPNSECSINANIWVEYPDGSKKEHVNSIRIFNEDEELEIGFSFDFNKNETFIYCNGKTNTLQLDGHIVDYSQAWLWVGASMPLESFDEEFRHFFFGEIKCVGIFSKTFTKNEYDELFLDLKNNLINNNTVAVFDFEEKTPYKILDISYTGNNLVKFDKTWMD